MAKNIENVCATCKTGKSTQSLRINEHAYVMFNRRIHVPKYTVSNIFSNSLIINELY